MKISITRILEKLVNLFLQPLRIYIQRGSSLQDVVKICNLLRPRRISQPLVRIGNGDGDGGYLLPERIGEISAVYSPGVGLTSSFEEHFANLGISCFLLDGSVSGSPIEHSNFYFQPLYLSAVTVPGFCITLSDWLAKTQPGLFSDGLLQMDIEGEEYLVLAATDAEVLKRFKVIVIELHQLSDLRHDFGRKIIGNAIEKLTLNHVVVHTHPNNCCGTFNYKGLEFPEVVEVTLVEKTHIDALPEWAEIPHVLDKPNVHGSEIQINWC